MIKRSPSMMTVRCRFNPFCLLLSEMVCSFFAVSYPARPELRIFVQRRSRWFLFLPWSISKFASRRNIWSVYRTSTRTDAAIPRANGNRLNYMGYWNGYLKIKSDISSTRMIKCTSTKERQLFVWLRKLSVYKSTSFTSNTWLALNI